MIDKENNDFTQDQFGKDDLNYPQIIRWQLNRIGMAGVMKGEGAMKSGARQIDYVEISVDILGAYLYPYMDKKFFELKKKATINKNIAPLDLLKCCVDLMHRRGLLLKKTIQENEA